MRLTGWILPGLALSAVLSGTASARVATAVPRVVASFPHDQQAFTEGLVYHDGDLFESTGMEGQSDIRRVRIVDGKMLKRRRLSFDLFGEGIAEWKDEIVSVTWQTGQGFRWRLSDLVQQTSFRYPGEGWGLTANGHDLVMSDGTPRLRFLDPVTFAPRRSITVTADGMPVRDLNELEWVDGEILANVWHTARIARIDPATGRVKGWLDLSKIADEQRAAGPEGVLNGIAWDAKGQRLFVTGKNWSKLYQIEIRPTKE